MKLAGFLMRVFTDSQYNLIPSGTRKYQVGLLVILYNKFKMNNEYAIFLAGEMY